MSSYLAFPPLPITRRFISVALSLESPPPVVSRRSVLRCSDFPRHKQVVSQPSGHLAVILSFLFRKRKQNRHKQFTAVNNSVVLYLILAILAVIAAVLIVVTVRPSAVRDFSLPAELCHDEILSGVRRLAAQSRDLSRDNEPMSIRFMRKYCRRALRIIESKTNAGESIDDYERRFAADYHVIDEAFAEVYAAHRGFSRLPQMDNLPCLYHLLSYLVGGSGGRIDLESLATYIEAYNAVRPLTWTEICNIKPMLSLALLERITVYASKIVKREEIRKRAARDVNAGRISEDMLVYNSYVRFVRDGGERVREKLYSLCRKRAIGPDGAELVDDKTLARYSGGVADIISSFQGNTPDIKYLLSLSAAVRALGNGAAGFSRLTDRCKAQYAEEISRQAKRRGTSEIDQVRHVLELSRCSGKDIAHYIVPLPLGDGYARLGAFCICLLSVAFCAIVAVFVIPALKVLCGFLLAPIFYITVNREWLYILGRTIRRRIVPEVKTDSAPPTAITYTVAVSSETDVRNAFENLATTAALNREEFFSYGLLIDCINDKYTTVQQDISRYKGEICPQERFFACLRKSPWERKRGAILQFNELVSRDVSEPFRAIWGSVRKFEYVITLDADTALINAARLVGMMEHPYNADRTIISVGMRPKISRLTTPFSRLISGDAGLTHYDAAASEPLFDVYGLGNYTGKGIYRTEKFNEILFGAFPDNRILSHDFIEGAKAGCADSGMFGLDEYPRTFSAYIRRQLRWARGDLQLAPWLRKRARNGSGNVAESGISFAARRQMFSNIVGVIYPVCALVLIMLCPIFNNFIYLALAYAPKVADMLLSLIGAARDIRGRAMSLLRILYTSLWVPTLGLYNFFACLVTAYRMLTKKNLLKWETYTASGGACAFEGNAIVAILFLIFGLIYPSAALLVCFALYICALPLDILLSVEFGKRDKTDKGEFLRLARLTWNFFEETLTERNNYLPCDNYQEGKGWANRTSPTNIGMALSSAVCACEIGIISEDRRDYLVGKILETLNRIELFRGIPYNWYEVNTLRPLAPKYVSAVDCGNLLAALLNVIALGGNNGRSARELIDNMDLAFLFDSNAGLFRIGYNADSGQSDEGHYDLLGSEAALTYLVSSACGKIPVSSYYRLSRRALKCGKNVLASWTGGMFEYLLPLMYFDAPRGSLVYKSAVGAVYAHKKYARGKSDVCAMSESLYGDKNDNEDYKYKAFGVYSISLSHERSDDVFAPYAAVMAATVSRGNNGLSQMLKKYSCYYGLYDSVDTDANSVQKSCMAHHQGMIMLAVADILCKGGIKEIMRRTAEGRAAELLLDEETTPLRHALRKPKYYAGKSTAMRSRWTARRTTLPQLNYLSNGNYMLVIDEFGRSYNLCNGLLLARFDRLSGMRVFVQSDGRYFEPCAMGNCRHSTGFSEYSSSNGSAEFNIRAGVVFDENTEFRKVLVKNSGNKPIVMSVIVVIKPCLTSRDADLSHKAFSSMFIETRYNDADDFVYARRTNSDNRNALALFVSTKSKYIGDERKLITGKGVSFGRTTEPILAATVEIELRAHESKAFSCFLAYGHIRQLSAYRRVLTDRHTDLLPMSLFNGKYSISDSVGNLGSYILFAKGRVNGAPPNVLLYVSKSNIDLALSVISELNLLQTFGIDFTVIILYHEPVSYFTEMSDRLNTTARALGDRCRIINELTADIAELEDIKHSGIDFFSIRNRIMPPYFVLPSYPHPPVEIEKEEIEFKLGNGGFTKKGGYYYSKPTPSPWYNVLSDGKIGCIMSDKGGFTFGSNSRLRKLTRHSNEEMNDEHGDGIILGEGGALWSITRSPLPHACEYNALHETGYSEFACGYNSFVSRMSVFVSDGVKYYRVKLENRLKLAREIDVMCFAELVLGEHITKTSEGIECHRVGDILMAENDDIKLFLSSSEKPYSYSFFAESYRGRDGKIRVCTQLENDGCTPALAYSVKVQVPPKGRAEVVFALSTRKVYPTIESVRTAEEKTKQKYSELANVMSDEAPIKYYLKWLSYQTLVSRFTAKCGFMQVGGATGFRDQLQDAVALLGICPEKVRAHLLYAASRQFDDGDVLHWWHEPAIGVRTRVCDDRLFLPYAVSEYVNYTGDRSVLSEQAAFLKSKKIPDGQSSLYAYMEQSDSCAPLAEHCIRAIKSVKLSTRGLVLMGSGDWNDGMDKVGIKGKGESVWCTMFLYYVIGKFSEFVDESVQKEFRLLRKKLFAALENCFDGDRYARAYMDDGRVLGVESSPECRIDLLAQSWAVLSGIATGKRAETVLNTAYYKLVDKKHGIIKLLDPPFEKIDAGYISDYPKGVRENGGQYTHAAVWFIRALYKAGMNDKANELLQMILPCNHTSTAKGVETYMKEPYVLAGDVYSGALAGRGGWTWYTGSAGWLYRVIVEDYYGIKIGAESVSVNPKLPIGKLINLNVRTPKGEFDLIIDSRKSGRWKTSIGMIGYEGTTIPLKSLIGKTLTVRRQKPID